MSNKAYAIVKRTDRPDISYQYYIYETTFEKNTSTITCTRFIDSFLTQKEAQEAIDELLGSSLDYKKLKVELQDKLREIYSMCNKLDS